VVAADGSGSRMIDPGASVLQAAWRTDGRHIAVSRSDGGTYIANADGSNLRRLPGINGAIDLTWSPDGKRLSFLTGDGDGNYTDQVNIADIDEDGALTDLRELTTVKGADDLSWSPDGRHLSVSDDFSAVMRVRIAEIDDAGAMTKLRQLTFDSWSPSSAPKWSPDGSQLAFELRAPNALRAGIVNPDGSGFRLIGPEVFDPGTLSAVYERQIGLTWAPDGRSLVLFEHPWRLPSTPIGPDARVWSVDVATGEQTEVEAPVGDWQRLAP